MNRNVTVSLWHFIIWSWRMPLNSSLSHRLIYSLPVSNIHRDLIYISKMPSFPRWNGYILLTCFINTSVLVAICKHTYSLPPCKVLLLIRGKNTDLNTTALHYRKRSDVLPFHLHGTLKQLSFHNSFGEGRVKVKVFPPPSPLEYHVPIST